MNVSDFQAAPYYGVRTTGIYCRRGCKSRAPLLKNVELFETPQAAERASYRACKRCKPDKPPAAIDERLVRVCRAIENAEESLPLRRLAEVAGMSEFHLQRSFKAAMGVSPKQYGTAIKRNRLRGRLKEEATVTDAIYAAGFGSASRAYSENGQDLGMTPTDFRAGAKHVRMSFAVASSPIGRVLVAATERGICRVDIGSDDAQLERRLRDEFPHASIRREDDTLDSTMSLIVAYLSGSAPWPQLPLDVRATAFQSRVWEALRAIAPGKTMTYAELARAIGSPNSARAVAQACASNPIALLIPCHRIVPQHGGGVGGYRWDAERKQRLLELERGSA